MMIWVVGAFMIIAVLAYLLIPFLRVPVEAAERLDYDMLVYRDQLGELERDVKRGLLPRDQAEIARTEIHRRALVSKAMQDEISVGEDSEFCRVLLALVILTLLPLGTGLMYCAFGHPELPAKPYAGRTNDPDFIVAAEARRLASLLEAQPDAEGFAHLGDIDVVLRKYEDAIEAYRNSLRFNPKVAPIWAGLGEAMVLQQGGAVMPDARQAFVKALRIDPNDPRALYYMGLSEAEAGHARQAVAIWRKVQAISQPDAGWLPMIAQQLEAIAKKEHLDPAEIEPAMPSLAENAPSDAAAAIMGMQGAEQKAAIHKMVDRLAARLRNNNDDLEGWQRLATAYHVLGEEGKAAEADRKVQEIQAKGAKQ